MGLAERGVNSVAVAGPARKQTSPGHTQTQLRRSRITSPSSLEPHFQSYRLTELVSARLSREFPPALATNSHFRKSQNQILQSHRTVAGKRRVSHSFLSPQN